MRYPYEHACLAPQWVAESLLRAEGFTDIEYVMTVDPGAYYMRTTPRFETAHPKYAFLNRLLAVSTGDRRAAGPIYTIDEIL